MIDAGRRCPERDGCHEVLPQTMVDHAIVSPRQRATTAAPHRRSLSRNPRVRRPRLLPRCYIDITPRHASPLGSSCWRRAGRSGISWQRTGSWWYHRDRRAGRRGSRFDRAMAFGAQLTLLWEAYAVAGHAGGPCDPRRARSHMSWQWLMFVVAVICRWPPVCSSVAWWSTCICLPPGSSCPSIATVEDCHRSASCSGAPGG